MQDANPQELPQSPGHHYSLVRKESGFIAEFPLISAQEREGLLSFNNEALHPGEGSLPAILASWASLNPMAPALVSKDITLSYATLNARVNRLANWLGHQGIGPGGSAAILLPRSGELVVALLAVLRAGGACLLLDPDWSKDRLQTIVGDAKPLLVLTCSAICSEKLGDAPCIELDTQKGKLAVCAETPPSVEVGLDQTACIRYASGTTGELRGIGVKHGQVLNDAATVSADYQLSDRRRFAQTSSTAADQGNAVLFAAIFNGGCLVVADADDMQDPASFAHFMAKQDIDCLQIELLHLQALLDSESPALLRTLILDGEAVPHELDERIAKFAPACRIHNHYGLTEVQTDKMPPVFAPFAWPDYVPSRQQAASRTVTPGQSGPDRYGF